jgi:nitroreductase
MGIPFTDLIFTRKSIRKYKPELPPQELIEDMIQCAARAPSPSNRQPVRFIRIVSPEVRQKLSQAMIEGRDRFLADIKTGNKPKKIKNWVNTYFRFSEFMTDAPLLFAAGIICEKDGFSHRLLEAGLIDQDFRGNTDSDISLGLSLKGFILRAWELGLGTCILTAPLSFIPEPESLMGVEGIKIRCFITAGYPDENPSLTSRKPLSEIYQEI